MFSKILYKRFLKSRKQYYFVIQKSARDLIKIKKKYGVGKNIKLQGTLYIPDYLWQGRVVCVEGRVGGRPCR